MEASKYSSSYLNLGTRLRSVVIFTHTLLHPHPRKPLNKRLYGSQNPSGPFADEKFTLPALIRTLRLPSRCLVTILTELPWFQGNDVIQHVALGTENHTLSFGAFLSAGIGEVSRVWEAVQ
jgi:hypothetical protein